ncbi:TraR/DksA family transcriptional regulator [Chromobacterium sphagni]|uniref:Uncharacterized protein n=1 Tax=Chromobacterium sphagni TaxID=1903179 RepID=A0A1S1WVP4_9NEIS|nr:TraR/DksA family transcriptional regulator [Chromobacterium sphagni]OHX11206.1 hypothetical protein BI347_15995 [Chromobacterium sphagni]OHX19646.1 hypothetical protein BI344_17360 [Chromobacterium sphagni]
MRDTTFLGASTADAEAARLDADLSPQQLALLHQQLLQARDALLRSRQETENHLREFLGDSDGSASDRVQHEEGYLLNLTVRRREEWQLQRLNEALQRIRNGCYGRCEETGEPIGMERLLACPTATLSRAAQEQQENRQRQLGG